MSILETIKNSIWDTVRQNIYGIRVQPKATPAEMMGEIDTELNGEESLIEDGSLIEAAMVAAREEYGVFLNRNYIAGLAHTVYYGIAEDLIRLLRSRAGWYRYVDGHHFGGRWVLDVGIYPDLEVVDADTGALKPEQRYSETSAGACTETLLLKESGHSKVVWVFEPAGWPYALQITACIRQA